MAQERHCKSARCAGCKWRGAPRPAALVIGHFWFIPHAALLTSYFSCSALYFCTATGRFWLVQGGFDFARVPYEIVKMLSEEDFYNVPVEFLIFVHCHVTETSGFNHPFGRCRRDDALAYHLDTRANHSLYIFVTCSGTMMSLYMPSPILTVSLLSF